ncbi:hypothetical protein X975_22186, partial [Stegodyphus mimosarum]
MKLLSVGLLLALACCCLAEPHCHTVELMNCLDIGINWLHTLPKRSIPATDSELETMCQELDKAFNCAYKFRDTCMTPLQKEVIALLVEGVIGLKEDFCKPGSDLRAKYLNHASCLNKVSQSDDIKAQIEYLLAILEMSDKVPLKDRLTFECCGYAKVTNAFTKMGTDTCGKEAVDTAAELISLAFAQLPDVVCNGFDGEADECKVVLPPDGSKPSEDLKKTA